jgi:hypothetical protein
LWCDVVVFMLPDQDRGVTSSGRGASSDAAGPVVFVDFDTVLLAVHPAARGPEYGLQADLDEAIGRLSEGAQAVVVLVGPPATDVRQGIDTQRRIELLRDGLGQAAGEVLIATCPHGGDGTCDCATPGAGLIEVAIEQHDLLRRGGWYVAGDQAGVVAGRVAGLHTIRIGPVGEDHLSAVHRPDYEARDLLDAANHILVEAAV